MIHTIKVKTTVHFAGIITFLILYDNFYICSTGNFSICCLSLNFFLFCCLCFNLAFLPIRICNRINRVDLICRQRLLLYRFICTCLLFCHGYFFLLLCSPDILFLSSLCLRILHFLHRNLLHLICKNRCLRSRSHHRGSQRERKCSSHLFR